MGIKLEKKNHLGNMEYQAKTFGDNGELLEIMNKRLTWSEMSFSNINLTIRPSRDWNGEILNELSWETRTTFWENSKEILNKCRI